MISQRDCDVITKGFVEGTFGHAAQQMPAESMREWLDDHRSELPAGVAAMLTAAFNCCVNNGLYTESQS